MIPDAGKSQLWLLQELHILVSSDPSYRSGGETLKAIVVEAPPHLGVIIPWLYSVIPIKHHEEP